MKYSLALSGGGARAFFHIGTAKYLEEIGIQIDTISGSSGGAIVGAFLSKYSADETYNILSNINYSKLVKFNFFKGGIFNLNSAKDILIEKLGTDNFEDLNKKLFICATNLYSGKATFFDNGSISDAIIASSSIATIFSPYNINDTLYIDGGYTNNLPISPLIGTNTKIIGINIYPRKNKSYKSFSIFNTYLRATEILIYQNTYQDIDKCDIYIEDETMANYQILSQKYFEEIYIKGYEYTKKYFDNLRNS